MPPLPRSDEALRRAHVAIGARDPSTSERHAIEGLKAAFEGVHALVQELVPSPRERALALTNLEQAAMWATKGICLGPPEKLTAPRGA